MTCSVCNGIYSPNPTLSASPLDPNTYLTYSRGVDDGTCQMGDSSGKRSCSVPAALSAIAQAKHATAVEMKSETTRLLFLTRPQRWRFYETISLYCHTSIPLSGPEFSFVDASSPPAQVPALLPRTCLRCSDGSVHGNYDAPDAAV
jgi:hypothetical protein